LYHDLLIPANPFWTVASELDYSHWQLYPLECE
jgi:hypothetical protein